MFITPVNEKTQKLLTQFLLPHEASCVQLCSFARKNDSAARNSTGTNNLYLLQNNPDTPASVNDIIGVIYADSTIFFCIPDINKIDAAGATTLKEFLVSKHKEHNIKSVSGSAAGTEFLVDLLAPEISGPYQVNHYNLMECSNVNGAPGGLANDDEIKRCSENDLDALVALQKTYLQEEVAPAGKKITDLEASMSLRQILKNQICLALFTDGEPVAKANTNAIGINYVQLGGVYTQPLYRRNGYAWQLVAALCSKTAAAGKRTALFVKDINVPAIILYKKLGFTESGKYTIAYF